MKQFSIRPKAKKGRKGSDSDSDLDFDNADIGPARDRPGTHSLYKCYGYGSVLFGPPGSVS